MTTGERDPRDAYVDVATGKTHCARPPRGWYCTRDPYHEGPCAASPEPGVSRDAARIECASYTDFNPLFGLYKEQQKAIEKWVDEHDKARHIRAGSTTRYSGAIGGAYTYEFIPTSIGTITRVRCSCGETIDVSDYDNW